MPPVAFTINHSLQPHLIQLEVPFVKCPDNGNGEVIVVVEVEVHPLLSVTVTV